MNDELRRIVVRRRAGASGNEDTLMFESARLSIKNNFVVVIEGDDDEKETWIPIGLISKITSERIHKP